MAKKVIVKQIKLQAGPDGIRRPGQQYEVDEKTAKTLLDARAVELVESGEVEKIQTPEATKEAAGYKPRKTDKAESK